jgi:tetratricopeptide (TPR) repeat protein
MAHNWHYATGGEKHGPITAPQLKKLVMTGQLAPDDLVWRDDMTEWRKASTVKGLFPTQSTYQPTAPPLPNMQSNNRSSFRKWLFIGGGSVAAFIVLITILTVTQTNAARNEIANAAILWEKGQHDEAVAMYQSIINKRGPFIPDDQEALVYGRVIDYLSQHNRSQEARLVLEKLNRFSPSVTPLIDSEPGQNLLADYRREQQRTKQQERRITKGGLGHPFEYPISSDDENYPFVEGCVRSFFNDSDAAGYTAVFKSLKGMNVYSFFTSKEIEAMKRPIEEVVLNTEKWTADTVCRMPPPEAFKYTVSWNYYAEFYRLSSGTYKNYKTVYFVANTQSNKWQIAKITFHVDYKNIVVTPWWKDDTSKVGKVSCETEGGWSMTGRSNARTGILEKVRTYGRTIFFARFEDDGSVVTGGDKVR